MLFPLSIFQSRQFQLHLLPLLPPRSRAVKFKRKPQSAQQGNEISNLHRREIFASARKHLQHGNYNSSVIFIFFSPLPCTTRSWRGHSACRGVNHDVSKMLLKRRNDLRAIFCFPSLRPLKLAASEAAPSGYPRGSFLRGLAPRQLLPGWPVMAA